MVDAEAVVVSAALRSQFRRVQSTTIDIPNKAVEIFFEDGSSATANYLARVDGKVLFTNIVREDDGTRWKPLLEAEGYWIGEDGRIMGPMGIRKLSPRTGGYMAADIRTNSGSKRTFFPHIEVAHAFIGRMSSDYRVSHISGDLTDNRAQNLEWVLNDEPKKAKADHSGRGPRHHISATTAEEIRELYADGYGHSQQAICEKLGVSRRTVSRVIGPTRPGPKAPMALV